MPCSLISLFVSHGLTASISLRTGPFSVSCTRVVACDQMTCTPGSPQPPPHPPSNPSVYSNNMCVLSIFKYLQWISTHGLSPLERDQGYVSEKKKRISTWLTCQISSSSNLPSFGNSSFLQVRCRSVPAERCAVRWHSLYMAVPFCVLTFLLLLKWPFWYLVSNNYVGMGRQGSCAAYHYPHEYTIRNTTYSA